MPLHYKPFSKNLLARKKKKRKKKSGCGAFIPPGPQPLKISVLPFFLFLLIIILKNKRFVRKSRKTNRSFFSRLETAGLSQKITSERVR